MSPHSAVARRASAAVRKTAKRRSGRSRPGGAPRLDAAAVRRDALLHIATRHFARHGYAGTDVQLIADEAGLGKGTVYRCFDSKEGLFLAARDRVMRLLDAAIDEARRDAADPLEQIANVVIRYLSFFDEHPEFVELVMLERAVFRDPGKPNYFQHREKRINRWQELYRRLMREGRVRQMPADVITDVLSSAVYGTMFTNYMAGRRKSLESQARQVIDVVFHGILVGAKTRPAAGGRRAMPADGRPSPLPAP